MKFLAIVLLVCLWFGATAQTRPHIFDLLPYGDFKHFKTLPFDSVVVFDSRADDCVSVWGDGTSAMVVSKLDSVSQSVQGLFMEACRNAKTEHRTLFIKIKEMRCSNQYLLLMLFWAEAYVSDARGFHKIARVDRGYRHEGKVNDAFFKKEIKKGFAELIEHIADNNLKDTAIYDLSYLKENIADEWQKSAPVLMADTFPPMAVYTFWGALRQNKFQPADFTMQMEPDSSYVIQPPEGKRLLQVPSDLYAVSYQGQLYISIIGKYFLPLNKWNGLMQFKIPESIPGMNVIYGMRLIGGDHSYAGSSDIKSMSAAAFASGIGNLMLKHRANVYEQTREAAAKTGEQIEMRDCFIDLNTGDIIYH